MPKITIFRGVGMWFACKTSDYQGGKTPVYKMTAFPYASFWEVKDVINHYLRLGYTREEIDVR